MKRSLTLADVKAKLRASPSKGENFLLEGLDYLLEFIHDDELDKLFVAQARIALQEVTRDIVVDNLIEYLRSPSR